MNKILPLKIKLLLLQFIYNIDYKHITLFLIIFPVYCYNCAYRVRKSVRTPLYKFITSHFGKTNSALPIRVKKMHFSVGMENIHDISKTKESVVFTKILYVRPQKVTNLSKGIEKVSWLVKTRTLSQYKINGSILFKFHLKPLLFFCRSI